MRQLVVWTVASLACVVDAQLVELTDAVAVRTQSNEKCQFLTDVRIGGSDWTDVVKTACLMWPPQFGVFPVNTTTQLSGLLNKLVESDVWQRTRDLFKRANSDYCLRKEVMREKVTTVASENTCPEVLDEDLLEEEPALQDPDNDTDLKVLNEGNWACQKETSPEDPTRECKCSRRDRKQASADEFQTLSIASRPSNCEMVHQGTCYGNCPPKYRPTWLKGWFRPVCTLVCADSNHPVTCGAGCASSRTACIGVILSQVKEVTLAASKVAAFVVSGPAGASIAATVESVVKVAEFGFNILTRILGVIDVTWKTFSREEAELATFVSIFQVLKEEAAAFVGDWAKLEAAMQVSSGLMLTLIDAEFGWKHINLGWVTNAILQYGGAALEAAFTVTAAFAYAECEPATDEVAFTVENVGDQRLEGTWSQDGSVNSRPRYRKISDRSKTLLEWSSRHNTWSFWYYDRTFGRGWWFGWAGFGWRELYYTKTNSAGFPTSGWRKDEGALPMPALVSTTNGGV